MTVAHPARRPLFLWLLVLLSSYLAGCVVDEFGNYRQGGDLSILAPPEPSQEDRDTAVDLSKQPVEKLFRLLAYELWREEQRPPEKRLEVRQFQLATETTCQERLLSLAGKAAEVAEDVRIFHLNITGTSGLFWLLREYPEEHSWVWVIAVSHDRVIRKVQHLINFLAAFALDDQLHGCLSPDFRVVLMNAATTWRKLYGDDMALLWNGVAFGILGDVTSWREVDDEGNAEDGPGGPPPNVSWSENLIFGNMWLSSVQKWLEYHTQEVTQAAYSELGHLQAGGARWDAAAVAQSPLFYSQDGRLSSFEHLRRQLFGGWPLDKGLLRGLLRHILPPSYGEDWRPSVADLGAGGGRYSQWLNETGLAEAFAFDGAHAVDEITGGAVARVNLAADLRLWRTFDWILCLEVGAYTPAEQAPGLLRTVRRHANQGLVMTWGSDPQAGLLLNPLSEAAWKALVVAETGFVVDEGRTSELRLACELGHLAANVTVFVPRFT